ncbi:MAG: TatD family hydrolase [Alysiella sp.]|uniref:TatD family hydrolase n=1 Tax=Alysiella sp. TaxID=1872483 RepID=UPI0026DC1C38|nr:TatD family hydrolase [Alysiella sp.]MDO4433757.1 TatD family hydrolase [Alysiella sp.]
MMLTDTHCHLAATPLINKLPEIITAASAANVKGFIVPSIQEQDWQTVLHLFRQPEIRAVALGIHPWFSGSLNQDNLSQLNVLLSENPNIWVGEIGLDFYPKQLAFNAQEQQIWAFEQQIDLAKQHQRPVILHNVKASAALLHSIKNHAFTYGGIVHAFSGSLEEAQAFIKLGFKIGIGTLLLNPNAKKVRHAASTLPLDALLLETDSPYMLPENPNTPANLFQIAQIVCTLRGIKLSQLAQACENNLQTLFPSTIFRQPNHA